MALIILQALPLCPSLAIFTYYSVLPHKFFQKISSKYGPLLYLLIFKVPIFLVSSASVACEIFRTHDVNVSTHGFRAIEGSLLFGPKSFAGAPYGDYYKFMKKLLVMNLFGPQALDRSRAIRADELERFYGDLLDKARKKEIVEIGKEVMKLTNNSICKMLMGRSFSEEKGEAGNIRESVKKTMGLLGKVVLSNTLGKLGISLFGKEIRKVSHGFDELLERMLREHEEKKPEKHQVKDMMDAGPALSMG
ncbi:unnamed protein product [Microthlaspi erraticum]|uniref:Cytochrome P450 n=1 Tax=Microthlaspi erraticum TaxID=1685480 RepID=A0A6D2HR34_9BRAS|nr:unnamed protein product [Microthlaspi erraticum]CAA7029927.1 unnamed protein product [Microthlaspi erraticum]